MSVKILEVTASIKEVEAVLRANLTPEEFATLRISEVPDDPFTPLPHRDLPTIQTVVEFVLASVASGITYDILKKVTMVLRDKLRTAKVLEVEIQPEAQDEEVRSGSDDVDGSE